MSFLKLKAVNVDKIWGNEQWIVSSHPSGVSTLLKNEKATNVFSEIDKSDFATFYENNKSMFGIDDEVFPLLVKILTAREDLSIQVHPNDDYAKKFENSLGKTECWYVLDAEKNADIIVGQTAKNKEELQDIIDNDKLLDNLKIIPVKKGDFLFIPAGCVHAIRKNTKLLEIQQSSDVTYRLFDYHRKDDVGLERELHVEKSLDVIDYSENTQPDIKLIHEDENFKQELLTKNEFFHVQKYSLLNKNSSVEFSSGSVFKILIVISGKIFINEEIIEPYQAIIIPINTTLSIENFSNTISEFIISGV